MVTAESNKKIFLRLSSRIGLRTVVASSLSLLAGLREVVIAEHYSADLRFCQENVGKACPSTTLKDARRNAKLTESFSVAPSPIQSHFDALKRRRPPKSAA